MYFGNSGLSLGSAFKVTNGGVLTATNATIGGIHVTGSAIYSGSHSAYDSSNQGFYLGSNGYLSIGDSNNYIRWNQSAISIKGAIAATSGTIGNIHIANNSIYSGSHTTFNSSNPGFYLDKDGYVGIGNSSSYIWWDPSATTKLKVKGRVNIEGGSFGSLRTTSDGVAVIFNDLNYVSDGESYVTYFRGDAITLKRYTSTIVGMSDPYNTISIPTSASTGTTVSESLITTPKEYVKELTITRIDPDATMSNYYSDDELYDVDDTYFKNDTYIRIYCDKIEFHRGGFITQVITEDGFGMSDDDELVPED